MISGIDSQQSYVAQMQSQTQQAGRKPPSAEDMFSKLSADVGGDGTTVSKDQLDELISKLESSDSSSEDQKKLGFLKQLQSSWDTISGGEDSITVDDISSNMEALKPPQGGPPPQGMSGSKMNWQDPSSITADQLESPIDIRV